MYSPMQSVSDLAWHGLISTSSSLHREHGMQALTELLSSEKVPGPHGWHMVFPVGLHSRTTPSPRLHTAHGAQIVSVSFRLHRKKPWPQSQWVSWVMVQRASWGIPKGHCEHSRHLDSPSESENVTPVMWENQ